MKLTTPYKCDYCPNIKGESNHWWIRDTPHADSQFRLIPWSEDDAAKGLVEHICSQACAVKALSKWLESFGTRPNGSGEEQAKVPQ